MHSISNALKAKFKDYGSSKLMTINTVTDSQHSISLNMNTIAMNTVSFEQILEPSDNLTFTGCNASVLKFRAKDNVTYLEGRPISMSIGAQIGENEYEYMTLFAGIVDSVKNTTSMQMSMDVVAYDFMKIINELDVTVWYNTLVFPDAGLTLGAIKYSLLSEIYNRIMTKYGVAIYFDNYDMPNDYLYIPKNLDDEHIYAGDLLKLFCQINGRYCQMRGFTCVFIDFEKEGLYPSANLYPDYDLYPSGVSSDEDISNASYKLGTLEVEKYTTAPIDGVQLIDKDNHVIAYEGGVSPLNIFTVSGNPLIYGLDQETLDEIAENLYEEIDGVVYVPLTLDMVGLPYLECGDYINVQVKQNVKSTYILHRVLSGEQALNDHIETKGNQYFPIFKPNTDDKIREAISKARSETRQMITEYDIAVNIMNDLAVNAIGGYQDYEDAESGGRIYYLSNRPITKNAQGKCVFEIGSTVFKNAGDGLYVSLDGGTTWTNGYNATTGRLVVNVLNAIGISADWIIAGSMMADRIRGGTLLVGGVNNEDGRILACTNQSVTISEGTFDGIQEDLYFFGEGSTIPTSVSDELYVTNDDEYSEDCPQPVRVTKSTGYWYQDPNYVGTDKYAMGVKDCIGNDDIYFFAYHYTAEISDNPVIGVEAFGVSKSPFTYYMWYGWMDNDGEWESEQRTAWSVTLNGETYYLTDTGSSGACGQTFRSTLDTSDIPAINDGLYDFIYGDEHGFWTVAHVILDGEIHSDADKYDLDPYYYNPTYYDDYVPAGTHVYIETEQLVAKTENGAHTYECFLQPNCYAVVIRSATTSPEDMLQIIFLAVSETQPYYTRIIDGDDPDTEEFDHYIENFIGTNTLWYTRLGGMYSCTLSKTRIEAYSSYDASEIQEIVRELGIVIYDSNSIYHYPNVVYLPAGATSLSADISNIVDPSKYEGLYQVYETEDAGGTFAEVAEGYLQEGSNFIDYIFTIDSDEVDTKYFHFMLTRSAVTYNTKYDFDIKKLIFMTEIDNDGVKTNHIEAEGGNFGIMEIDASDPNNPKLVVPKANNTLIDDDYRDFTRKIIKTTTFIPYYLLWTQDATLSVDFFSDVSYGASETSDSCKITIKKKGPSTSHTVGTFHLNSKGKIRTGTHAGEDPVFSEAIDHEWGKNEGEFYEVKYYIYKRSFTTGDHAYIKLIDETNTAQAGTIITPDEIISHFKGNFEGQASFDVLELGDWSFNKTEQRMEITPDESDPTDYDDTYYGRTGFELLYQGAKLHAQYNNINMRNSNNDLLMNLTEESIHFYYNTYDYKQLTDDGLKQYYYTDSQTYGYTLLHHLGLDIQSIYHDTLQSVTDELNITSSDVTKSETASGSTVSYSVTWSTSDERVKEDIIDLATELSMKLIDATNPKKFRYKGTKGTHYGMLAQDVRKQLDDLGEEDSLLEHSMKLPKEKTGLDDQRTIDYQDYIPHLINYVKELKAEIDSLKAEIKTLKGE